MTPDEIRDRIAAAQKRAYHNGVRPRWVESGQKLDFGPVADALMPTVREAIAAELDAAADELENRVGHRRWLRTRAARWRADQ